MNNRNRLFSRRDFLKTCTFGLINFPLMIYNYKIYPLPLTNQNSCDRLLSEMPCFQFGEPDNYGFFPVPHDALYTLNTLNKISLSVNKRRKISHSVWRKFVINNEICLAHVPVDINTNNNTLFVKTRQVNPTTRRIRYNDKPEYQKVHTGDTIFRDHHNKNFEELLDPTHINCVSTKCQIVKDYFQETGNLLK